MIGQMMGKAAGDSIMGFRLVVSPDRPKYQLPKDIQVTQEFREDFDRWALGFFGTDNLLDDGQMLVIHDRELVMNPRSLEALKAEMRRRGGWA